MTPKIRQVLDDLMTDTNLKAVTWRMNSEGEVRAGGHCPLSYLAKTEPCNVEIAASKLDLPYLEAALIANAADGFCRSDRAVRDVRSALLRACRLSEAA